jgi:hypothetical protein
VSEAIYRHAFLTKNKEAEYQPTHLSKKKKGSLTRQKNQILVCNRNAGPVNFVVYRYLVSRLPMSICMRT